MPNSVTVLDAATLAVLRSYRLPGGPDDIAFAPDGKLWFTLRFVNKVAVLDPASGQHRGNRRRPLAARHLPQPARAGAGRGGVALSR